MHNKMDVLIKYEQMNLCEWYKVTHSFKKWEILIHKLKSSTCSHGSKLHKCKSNQ